MIAYLRGKLISVALEHTILEVNGVGYKLYTPASIINYLPEVGAECCLHTHLYVREDALQLYGFNDQQDLAAFELLISVSGVGPKVALAVLSTFDSMQLNQAVLSENLQALTKIPGVGKKTAQRLVLELKDKLAKGSPFGLGTIVKGQASGLSTFAQSSPKEDAIGALEALGYPYQQACQAVEQAFQHNGADAPVEILIKSALQSLAKL